MNQIQQHARSRQLDPCLLRKEIAALENLSIASLRMLWKSKLVWDAPTVRSPDTLRRLLAFELQAAVFGGYNRATSRKLQAIAKTLERDGTYEPQIRRLRTGAVLTREWKGTVHKVTVAPNGFDYRGYCHKSLSDIARLITRTRWSGPRFFGLEQKRARLRGVRLELR